MCAESGEMKGKDCGSRHAMIRSLAFTEGKRDHDDFVRIVRQDLYQKSNVKQGEE